MAPYIEGGSCGLELDVRLAPRIPLTIGGRDIDNYLFPLISRLEGIAHERGIGEVHLDTAVRKTHLVAVYTKRGYVAFDEVFAWPGTNYDSRNFRKVLKPAAS